MNEVLEPVTFVLAYPTLLLQCVCDVDVVVCALNVWIGSGDSKNSIVKQNL
jgi:hypothetical protein